MILGSGLTPAEQAAFDVLIRFFEGEPNAERKAMAVCVPFAVRSGFVIGDLTEEGVADIVMGIIADYAVDAPEIEYCWGERRDTRRDERRNGVRLPKV